MQTYEINGERYVVMTQTELDLALELRGSGVTDTKGLPADPFSNDEHMVNGIRVQRFYVDDAARVRPGRRG